MFKKFIKDKNKKKVLFTPGPASLSEENIKNAQALKYHRVLVQTDTYMFVQITEGGNNTVTDVYTITNHLKKYGTTSKPDKE